MRSFLCALGFHGFKKIKGEPGIYNMYWLERCKHCPAERTTYERLR